MIVALLIAGVGVGVVLAKRSPALVGDDVDWKALSITFPDIDVVGWEPEYLAQKLKDNREKAPQISDPDLRKEYEKGIQVWTDLRDRALAKSASLPKKLEARMMVIAFRLPHYKISTMKLRCPPILKIIEIDPYLFESEMLVTRLREYAREVGDTQFTEESPTLSSWLAQQKSPVPK